jgi:hypothetical protein
VITGAGPTFDLLRITVGVTNATARGCDWNGVLSDLAGNEIDFQSGYGTVAAGQTFIKLDFVGFKLAQAANGPYAVTDFSLNCNTDRARAGTLFQTQVFSASQFTYVSPDFRLSVGTTASPGPSGTRFAIGVIGTPVGTFQGAIALTVNGLPAGANAAVNHAMTLGGGICTLFVTTAATTPVGTYPLKIIGTSGSLSHTATANLVITSTQSAFLTGGTFSTVRNNASGLLGMEFTVGPQALTVTALGRMFLAGNAQSHLVKLVNAATGADVAGGSVNLSMAGGVSGQYSYAAPSAPLQLPAGSSYYLVSQEYGGAGNDTWYDYSPVSPTSAASVPGAVYKVGAGYVLLSGAAGTSYVPVNFLYTGGAVTPSAAITAPVGGTAVLGRSVTVSASASAAAGLTIASVQFQVDGVNLGSAVSGAGPYSVVLDSTALTNGSHSLTAVATDSAGTSASSPGAIIIVSNNTPFLTGGTFTVVRNNASGLLGMEFTVGSQSVTVTALWRMFLAGNSQSHLVKLVDAVMGADVAGGAVNVSMAGGTVGQYSYAPLNAPLVLPAGSSYYLVSQEFGGTGNDTWYDYSPVSSSSVAGIPGAVYNVGSGYTLTGGTGYSFVPVNFLYQ